MSLLVWAQQARGLRRSLAFLIILALGGLAACQGTPAPPPAVMPAPAALAATSPPQPTLPATWTPTSTFTPRPPSATPTMTLTPAPSPTLDDAGRCAAFAAIGTPEEGVQAILGRHGRVSFSWRYPVAGESATLTVFREREPALTRTLTLSGTALTIAVVPFRALWGPGRYSWRLAPNDAAGAPLAGCMAAGSFTLLLRDRLSRTDSAGPQMSD